MGAYLSAPSVEKKSDDFDDSEKFSYGVSRMQGWRISMEDAHNCVPSFENNSSLFGVYDGHGGSEVAMYCALHFSDVLKDLHAYKEGRYEDALKETFMSLDKILLESETIRELKVLADRDPDSGPPSKADIEAAEAQEEEEECEEDEMKLLHEEATMSIEELLERYGKAANETKLTIDAQRAKLKEENLSGTSGNTTSETASSTSSMISSSECGVSSSASTGEVKKEKTQNDAQDDSVSSSSDIKMDSVSQASTCSVSSSSSGGGEGSSTSSSDQPSKKSSEDACSSSCGEPNEMLSTDDKSDDKITKETLKQGASSEKFQPKLKSVKLKWMTNQEEEGTPDESDSESDEDGFDSDEAVEGSSDESEEEEDDDEEEDESEEEEDIDISEIPSIAPVSTTIEEPGKDSGTTAVVAFLKGHELLVANAGDSRCVLSRNGVAVDMSEDHKPEDDSEIKRIKAAGGHVNMQGRVNGGLNLSRAIGDHCYKTNKAIELENQMISAMPDIKKVNLQPGDDFMILACDGIWNVFSSQEVVDFIRVRIPPANDSQENFKLSSICEELLDTCLAPDTTGDGTGCDNMTCIVVRFNTSWLQKSNSASSGDAKDMNVDNVKIIDSNSIGEAKIIVNNETDNLDAQKSNLNLKINGENENGKIIEDNSATGCKRPRTENNLDSTDMLDLTEQTTKKQKVA
ncbi:protein phosphatase 1G-like [Styela clava]